MKLAIHARDIFPEQLQDAVNLIWSAYKRGATICYSAPLYEQICRNEISHPRGDVFEMGRRMSPGDFDLLLLLGGDGTFLSSLPLVCDSGIPVVGINYGRLGFLSAVEPAAGESLLDALFNRRYEIVERSLLEVHSLLEPLPGDFYPYALNEVALSGQHHGIVAVQMSVGKRQLPVFWADGLLVATPTGSTAYSLSLGGPIVLPNSEVMLISPIASHNLNVRPMVIPADETVEIIVTPVSGGVSVSADNRFTQLESGFRFSITKACFKLRCISLSDNYFIDALRTKLHWGDDGRNI